MWERELWSRHGWRRRLSQLDDAEIDALVERVRVGTIRLRDDDPEMALLALDVEKTRRRMGL